VQISKFMMDGRRLEIPDPEQLPGDAASFPGLGMYIDLVQRCQAQSREDRPTFGDIVVDLR
jgi:hypothetical protein